MKNRKSKDSVYEILTNSIIELLEKGVVPWQQPWKKGSAVRSYHGNQYRGFNAFYVSAMASMKGLRGAWITFNQVKKLGGCVKKGEKSTLVVYWTWVKEKKDGQETGKTFPICRYYRVFSICQTEGIDDPSWMKKEQKKENEDILEAENVFEGYQNRPELKIGGDRACYIPSDDQVCMPEKNCFESSEKFYLTLFHELIHSTGHESRLDRFEQDAKLAAFGSESYSKEELVAEIGATMLSSEAGFHSQDLLEHSASYIQSWITALKGDPRLVVLASAQAQKATDLILNKKFEDSDK